MGRRNRRFSGEYALEVSVNFDGILAESSYDYERFVVPVTIPRGTAFRGLFSAGGDSL